MVVKSVEEASNTYLKGHENPICILAVSPTGKLLASGERVGGSVQAALIVWDFEAREMLYRVRYHIDMIQASNS